MSRRIADLQAAATEPLVSFEFSPPKSPEAAERMGAVLEKLAPVNPAFISVTYGALGSTRSETLDVVVDFNSRYEFPTMAHLTCVGHTRADIADLLDAYAAGGVRNILALGGDPPADGSDPGGDFTHAIELVETVKAHRADFSVGVAAHPEKHPRSPSVETDRCYLADKLAIADFAVTQFFFDVDPYWRLLDELAALGCTKPVVPGVMPFISVAGARRMSALNDTTIGAALEARLDDVDGDADAVRALGVDVASEVARALLDNDVAGLHLYTMNQSAGVLAVLANLGMG
jgi:methylenetetrahydrofolate reductase (NADPH)